MSEVYDWEDAAKPGKQRAPKIPPSDEVDLEIKDIVFGGKSGAFKSSQGDPQIMLIFSDGKGNEAGSMVTLSDKAAWTLAQILAASGTNLAAMKQRGIRPEKFTDERFARANLVGKRLKGAVAYEQGNDGKSYARITPLRPEPAMAGGDGASKSDDEIPI
jgi:hypothetical protein